MVIIKGSLLSNILLSPIVFLKFFKCSSSILFACLLVLTRLIYIWKLNWIILFVKRLLCAFKIISMRTLTKSEINFSNALLPLELWKWSLVVNTLSLALNLWTMQKIFELKLELLVIVSIKYFLTLNFISSIITVNLKLVDLLR